MSDAFDQVINPLLDREGGYVNDPADHGGGTKFGITQAVARAHGYSGAMQDLPRSTAVAIYRADYWAGPHFDVVAAMSQPVAAELFDTGVNMGVKTAGTFLQRALNVLNDAKLLVDGSLGKASTDAMAALMSKRGSMAIPVLLKTMNALQLTHYVDIIERDPTQHVFGWGWIANRT